MMTSPEYSDTDAIANKIATDGYAVVPDFISSDQVALMANEIREIQNSGMFRRAGVGKAAEYTLNSELRGDFIHWLEGETAIDEFAQGYLERIEKLRLSMNGLLALGLFEFEGHYAIYPPGAYYSRHLDQFKHDARRTLTSILYLNSEWEADDGGALRMYLDGENSEPYIDISPVGGTLVTFLSSRFWHEVLPARRERISLTGWFKTRS